MFDPIRAALERLVELDNSSPMQDDQWAWKHENAIADAIEALSAAPPAAAAGEVGELLQFLRDFGDELMNEHGGVAEHNLLTRAADLLSIAYATGPELWEPIAQLPCQRHPAPVPVAERPWERDGWCDEQGRCWWGSPCGYTIGAAWSLREVALRKTWETHCLPFTALPLPAGEVEQ